MRYDEFRDLWCRCFQTTRSLEAMGQPAEYLDLNSMDRRYEARFIAAAGVEPYTLSARLWWRWDSLQAARTCTTEEDLLTTLLGNRDVVDTERPWLRVDVALVARTHLDARVQLPGGASWKMWVLEIAAQMDAHLSIGVADDGAVQSWRGEPSVELRCGPGGQLFLTGVELEAWRMIELPRAWDDPALPRDPDPEPQIAALARDVSNALDVWAAALRTLGRGSIIH